MEREVEGAGPDLSSGIYTWDIITNTVFADRAAAFLFGLDPVDAAKGLPIERFLERVHEEDRGDLAEEIINGMMSSEPFQMQYRVCATSKVWVNVMAFGQCFRNARGEPTHFSGIVHPIPVDHDNRDAIWHLLAAFKIFEADGQIEKAEMVRDVLRMLANPGENPLNIVRLYH